MNCPTSVGNLEASTAAEENLQDEYIVRQPGSVRSRSSRSSGGPCAQSAGQAKRHRSAREISRKAAILCSSMHRIIHCDVQLKRFKRRRA